LATRLASPQIVLPWVYNLIGGPLFLIGLLVPSVRMGGLLAQLTIVPVLMAREFRKNAFVLSSYLIAGALILMCLATLNMSIVVAASIFFLCLLVAGGCNGIITLASQEVMAKSVSGKRIGRLLALQASVGGILTLVSMAVLYFVQPDSASKLQHLLLIFLSAGFWVIAGFSFWLIREPASEIQPRQSVWAETRRGWELFLTTPWFRRFFLTRALFLSVGLATPFYSIHAAMEIHASPSSLSLFVFATGVTSMLSGPIWARLLGANPCRVLVQSGLLAAAAGVVAILHSTIGKVPVTAVFMLVFALLDLAVQGLTQASKTYLAIQSPDADRPRFLAINNALLGVIGVVVSGLIGMLAHSTHILASLGLLIVLALIASYSAMKLKVPQPSDSVEAPEGAV